MTAKPCPDFESYVRLREGGCEAPLSLQLPADLETPVSAYLKLSAAAARNGGGMGFLLESVERGELLGRYSFIGSGIQRRLELRGSSLKLVDKGAAEEQEFDGGLLEALRSSLGHSDPKAHSGQPALLGGAVGYLGYDIVRHLEKLPSLKPDILGEPDGVLLLPESLVEFDHATRMIRILALPKAGVSDLRVAYDSAAERLELARDALRQPLDPELLGNGSRLRAATAHQPVSNFTREGYEAAVLRAKDYIAAGDIFQVVLSQRLSGETTADSFQIYRALRLLNPSPYMFFLDLGELKLIGSSPEVLVKLKDGEALLNPIAGTRPRGEDATEDAAMQQELLASEKERAEHVMLVDLARNDLGRVCATGSVTVPQFMKVEHFSHVMHLVSNVTGHLNGGHDSLDLLAAAFPAGTVSGAPKVRAMEIIEELEPCRRGPYSGAVGYIGANGDLDTCIAIRTIVMQGQAYHLQAGAGIVADSEPAAEYEETLAKMAALRQAIKLAEEGL